MQILPRMVLQLELNGDHTTQMYTIGREIPTSFVEAAEDWVSNRLDLDKVHVTITDNEAISLLTTIKGRSVSEDGLGFLEIELRGLLVRFDSEDKLVVVNNTAVPYLHLTNGVQAFCIDISDVISFDKLDILAERSVDYLEDNGYYIHMVDGSESPITDYSSDILLDM